MLICSLNDIAFPFRQFTCTDEHVANAITLLPKHGTIAFLFRPFTCTEELMVNATTSLLMLRGLKTYFFDIFSPTILAKTDHFFKFSH